MTRLFPIIYALAGSTLAGTGVIAALTLGLDTLVPILVAAAIGAVAAVPVTWLVVRALLEG